VWDYFLAIECGRLTAYRSCPRPNHLNWGDSELIGGGVCTIILVLVIALRRPHDLIAWTSACLWRAVLLMFDVVYARAAVWRHLLKLRESLGVQSRPQPDAANHVFETRFFSKRIKDGVYFQAHHARLVIAKGLFQCI